MKRGGAGAERNDMIAYLECLMLSMECRAWLASEYLALNRGDRERAAECYEMAQKAKRRMELITMRMHV